LNNVPDGTGVTYAVEYYIDSAEPLEGDVMLVTDGVNGDKTFADRAVGAKGVVFYSLSAEAVDAIQAGEGGETRLRVKALGAGGGKLYVLGVKILDSQYMGDVEAVPYSYYDFEKTLSNAYYPEESGPDAYQLTYEDIDGDYRGFRLAEDAPAFAASATENKAVYLRFFTKEGYENTNVVVDAYEVYGEATAVSATVTDGVGAAVIPAACFRNDADYGSFRLATAEAEKLARVEVYDMATYCAAADAEADTVAAMHAAMLENKVNTKLLNAKPATDFWAGYTGDTVCVTCGAQLAAGEEIPAAGTLPEPYGWFDTDGGVLTTNRTMSATGLNGSMDVSPIPGTDEYGICLNGDWNGFWFDASFAKDVPADQSVTLVVKYYIDKSFAPTDEYQLFRYQAYEGWQGGTSDGNAWNNLLTCDPQMKSRQAGLFYYTFTAADRAVIGNGPACFSIVGCGWSAGSVYIQSARLVDTAYVRGTAGNGYAVWDSAEQAICDYYPTVAVSQNHNLSTKPEGTAYMHFAVEGDALATDRTVNKPVYIKVYTKEGYENTTVAIQQFEAYTAGDRWACNNGYAEPQITVVNGTGGVLLPETSFTNSNNGGSFRFVTEEFKKVTRVQVYDVATFCKNTNADVEDIATIHAAALANNVNIKKVGREEATAEKEGYTGDAVCASCGELLERGTVIPVVDPNRPLAMLDTAGGTLTLDGCTVSGQGIGTTEVVSIGDTGKYGIQLPQDWAGFNVDNLSLVGSGGKVAMLIEYYLDMDVNHHVQVFRYKINDRPHTDVYPVTHNLVGKRTGLAYHIFTEEELAAIGDNNFTFRVMGCIGGAGVTYIQSVKLVRADLLDLEMDKGYIYTEFAEKPITNAYPDVSAAPSYNMGYANLEPNEAYPDREWTYRYIFITGDLLGVRGPAYIKLYAAQGHENDTVTIESIERFGEGATVQMTDGVGALYLPSVTFTNGLDGVGSLRMWCEEAEKITRIEIVDVRAYCGNANADAALVAEFHASFAANRTNVNIVGKKEATEETEGYTGDIYCVTCNDLLQEGTMIPKLEPSNLPAPFAYFDTANGSLKTVGVTLVGQGADPVPLPIGSSGEYGIKLTGDWQGFRMEGMKLPTDKEITVAIEYYVNAYLSGSQQMFRYQSYGEMPGVMIPDANNPGQMVDNHYYDVYSDQDNLVSRQSGLLLYSMTPEAVAAINNGDSFKILGCNAGSNIVYIQSVRVIDTAYLVADNNRGYDFIRFEEAPLCQYYPDILGTPGNGITVSTTREGVDPATGEEQRYAYFKVTRALAKDGQIFRPVVIRFTFKEDSTIEYFEWQYQGARRTNPPDGSEWSHQSSTVKDGVVEILLTTACFANELNGLGSFRVSNRASSPVLDNLLMVEVVAVADTTALQALVDGVDEAVVGKTKEAAEAYRALVAEKAALLEDVWTTDAAVAAAVAEIRAAAEAMEDCAHTGGTFLDGAREVSNHVVAGYTGDLCCEECNARLTEGEVIPAHYTDIINAKAPTCDELGHTGDRWCFDCDQLVQAGNVINRLPHTWDDGVVTKPAKPDEKGEVTITCTVCGATKVTRLDFTASLGDVNEDGAVDSTDARLVLQFAVKKIQPNELKLKVADVNGDGRTDSTDARLILQYAVRKIDSFPA